MPEYRRFIAYFYEYIDGKKQKNAGFAKVELRNGMWRILFRLTAGELPQAPVQAYGFVRERGCLLGFPMGTMPEGREIAEEWAYRADSPIGFGKYRMEELAGIWIQSSDGRHFVTVWDDDPISTEKFVLELPQEGEVSERVPEDMVMEAAEEAPENISEPAQEQEEVSSESLAIETMEAAPACRSPRSSLAEEMMEKRQKFQPFPNQEFVSCVKLLPCDIARMQQENWQVGRSSFLQHGYYQYQHLLLGKTKDGQYVLGVPGLQNRQEQYMAGMFGYDRFRAVRRCNCGHMFGYWCRVLTDVVPAGIASGS